MQIEQPSPFLVEDSLAVAHDGHHRAPQLMPSLLHGSSELLGQIQDVLMLWEGMVMPPCHDLGVIEPPEVSTVALRTSRHGVGCDDRGGSEQCAIPSMLP